MATPDICPVCSGKFKRRYNSGGRKICCSRRCAKLFMPTVQSACEICGTRFLHPLSAASNSMTFSCSIKCREQARRSLSSSSTCLVCGIALVGRFLNGKGHRQKLYCSRKCSGRARILELVRTSHVAAAAFAVLARIGRVACERCGDDRIGVICVHHRNRNRNDNSFGNLEVLCANCHALEHFRSPSSKSAKIFENAIVIHDALSKGRSVLRIEHAFTQGK